ncbi:MAG: hypothetical protein WAJ93_01735 [Candidatus Nitrosopolaris sp.]
MAGREGYALLVLEVFHLLKYIHALVLHLKIIHKQAGTSSSGCHACKEIEANIEGSGDVRLHYLINSRVSTFEVQNTQGILR